MDALLKHTRPLPKLSYNVHQCNAIVRSGTLLLGNSSVTVGFRPRLHLAALCASIASLH